ncbi:MAG: DUF1801 domain-containing protein [Clostridiales bacterium]|nr:DUF1801 domain-containing protein [Clostridiales bacterium]
MDKYRTIDEFLSDQSSDKLEQINTLRELIIQVEPNLAENLKWNAPNYVYKGEDRITFNVMNKQDIVKVIIHMGATKKEDKKSNPILANDQGIVEWSSDIRGAISFDDISDIYSKMEMLLDNEKLKGNIHSPLSTKKLSHLIISNFT